MIEHNNRAKAKRLAEYITGDGLRRLIAERVHHYAGRGVSLFDGACGSGQLAQYVEATSIEGVDVLGEQITPLEANAFAYGVLPT